MSEEQLRGRWDDRKERGEELRELHQPLRPGAQQPRVRGPERNDKPNTKDR